MFVIKSCTIFKVANSHFLACFLIVVRASIISEQARVERTLERNPNNVFSELGENAHRVDDQVVVLGHELKLSDLFFGVGKSFWVSLQHVDGMVALQLVQFDLVGGDREVFRVKRNVVGKCIYVHLWKSLANQVTNVAQLLPSSSNDTIISWVSLNFLSQEIESWRREIRAENE